MQKHLRLIAIIVATASLSFPCFAQEENDLQKSGTHDITVSSFPNAIKAYSGSYALIISQTRYSRTDVWPPLAAAAKTDADKLADLLRTQGFGVEREDDLSGLELVTAIHDFIEAFGKSQTRLVIYYAGHGATDQAHLEGFLVGTDAESQTQDPVKFYSESLSTDQILKMANASGAKHTLFIFDSCFSGAAFRTREGQQPVNGMRVRDILKDAKQFISSTNEYQPSPDISVFTPSLIEGLSGAADFNHDGLILASELAEYLKDRVSASATPTIPQYGDVLSAGGDFMFLYKSPGGPLKDPVAHISSVPSIFKDINVIYFRKAADRVSILEMLRNANIPFTSTRSPNPETLESDGLACSIDTPIQAVKSLAMSMIRAGHEVRAIIPIKNRPDLKRTIEIVSYNDNGSEWSAPGLDEDEINAMTSCNQTAIGVGKG